MRGRRIALDSIGVRARRAWIYVLSVLALLVPAGGIAYLGGVSYRAGAGALLGIARVLGRVGETTRATAMLDELDRRFGERSFPKGGTEVERVPVRLVTALMRAEAAGDHRPDALLELAEGVLTGRFAI